MNMDYEILESKDTLGNIFDFLFGG